MKKEDLQREVTLDEIKKILATTVVHDDVPKVFAFLTALLTYTDRDQVNVTFKAESSTGKTYIVQQILEYFPKEDIIRIAYSSPTAFYHDEGELCDKDGIKIDMTKKPKKNDPAQLRFAWKKRFRNSMIVINLKQKILVFLDQPHDDLLKRLRPVLSHDDEELFYRITDKTARYGLKAKKICIKGFPTVFFCSAKVNIEDQERTRHFILSPESTPDKIARATRLAAKRLSDWDKFKKSLADNPDRQWLIQRIRKIKGKKIRSILIPNVDQVVNKFLGQNRNLTPRMQRDFPRLLSLIKAHALLNCFTREQRSNRIIVANQTDIETGFKWYTKIVKSNELGLAPETHDFYKKIFEVKPDGLTKDQILHEYQKKYGRILNIRRLEREILPALKSAGLIIEQPCEYDRRFKLYIPLKGRVEVSPQMDDYKSFQLIGKEDEDN